ncbi:alpha-glucosidase [Benzoatithermus flavus]|uniref:Alpha-glucosidase n=1 Tax=Benzoatithermus flavus TaxID=3108223 RepID=A0ABU8XLP0_9PROT
MRRALLHASPRAARRRDEWWRGAVIYQIYPRSFFDTDGDGVGDLPGITEKLDYVEQLGVDAVWISPFFKSPMKDFGYDVADYRAVDPLFGTLEDFDALLEKAHRLGLKVLIDFVPSHTSNEHPWFQESRSSRDNEKADWYVWADPRPDGSPPNNWLSVFGGSAWEWEPRRGQYYLHNFLKEQPQLNLWNPAVVQALLDAARFWLDRGVDGFRLDAIDHAVHDPQLRNNPPRSRRPSLQAAGSVPASPYKMQEPRWNRARPELVELFLKPLHALTERYEGKVLLGEISTSDDALIRAAEYTNGGGLDMAYTFDLPRCEPSPRIIRRVVERFEGKKGEGWACWSFGNHDVCRPVTRFGGDNAPEALRRLLPVLLGCLRGTPCLYQGEELGLEEAELGFEQLRDPYGLAFWPAYKGRDGCRTPIPWRHDAPHGGFTTGEPWLPVPAVHLARAVDVQAADPDSTLNATRAFFAWRRRQPLLKTGTIRFLKSEGPLLVFARERDGQRMVCAFNLSGEPQRCRRPRRLAPEDGRIAPGSRVAGRTIELGPWGYALVLERAASVLERSRSPVSWPAAEPAIQAAGQEAG